MRANNNHYHYNYYINNNSSIRASLNTNINCNSPKSFTRSPNAHTKFTSPNFNQSTQSFSTKVLPRYKTLKTQEGPQEKQKNKTTFIPPQKNQDSKKNFYRQNQTGKTTTNPNTQASNHKQKPKIPISPQLPELRMTLDVVNFTPRPQDNSFKRQTIFSPKPSTGGGSFWKSRKTSKSKTPNNKTAGKTEFKQKIFVANRSKGINRFKLLKLIGQGTYSDVYLSIQKKTLTLWAVKRLKKSLINTKQLKEQFSKMITSHFKLNHPNIIKIYDIFSDQNYIYLVEQYMETGSLEKYMFKKKAVLKENDIGEKVSEIGSGIKYLHKNNIIHGGLKPSSILLCHDTCKLPSLECLDEGTLNLTTLCKDTNYAPPEALSSKGISPAFDLWCLGLIFYEFQMQKPLFSGATQKIIMRKIVNFSLQQIKLPPQTYYQVEVLIKGLLQPNPKQRLTADQLMDHNYIIEHRTDNEWNSLIKTQNGSTISNKTLEQ